jgi:hypothetical protein
MYRIRYTQGAMSKKGLKRIPAIFFRTATEDAADGRPQAD